MDKSFEIQELCKQHTSLADEEIGLIIEKSKMMQTIADLSQSHVFIDCIVKDNQKALVVAEAFPTTDKRLYKEPVVGNFIYETYEPAVFRAYRTGQPEMVNRAVTHEGVHVNQNVMPILNHSGKPIGLLISEKDITTQVKHEKEIAFLSKTTEEFSRTFWDLISRDPSIPDVIEEALLLLNENGEILYANNFAISLLQMHYEEGGPFNYKNKRLEEILPFVKKEDYFQKGIVEQEVTHRGRVYIKRIIGLQSEETERKLLVNLRDISDLREKERQLVVKSAVIKEIHHRVKNNLQTVASLLRLQMRRGVPEETKALYKESLNRILSIATVHEYLSYSGIEEVDIKQILEKIAKMLIYNTELEENPIKMVMALDSITLKSNQAVSLALIFTEILQNSVKHGYKNGNGGQIDISLKKENEVITLSVKDDGVGFNPDDKKEQLGLEIVRNLTQFDLSGTFDIYPNSGRGTTAKVQFCLEEEGES
ncbi:sensor histidine kinase [Fictibacillus sp. Mic-4]|uniref:sensor histidine kinase n=1 Tax=Fictibacillus TaxID=1329200 RepID=UPI00041C4DC5|nr:sensor histidine kinase [Fictibacillus gelatini]